MFLLFSKPHLPLIKEKSWDYPRVVLFTASDSPRDGLDTRILLYISQENDFIPGQWVPGISEMLLI